MAEAFEIEILANTGKAIAELEELTKALDVVRRATILQAKQNNEIKKSFKSFEKTTQELAQTSKKTADSITKITNKLNKLENETKKQTASNKEIEKSFKGLEKTAGKFTTTLSGVVAGYLSLQGASLVVSEMATLEEGFIGVAKTTGLAGEEFDKLKQGLLELSTQIAGVSTENLLSIAESAGQLGIQGRENILKFTETVSKIAVATDLTAEQASTSLAKMSNTLQLPIADVERLGSTINELSNTTTATASQLVDVGNRVAGMGKQIGLTADEILALSATMKDIGMTNETAGSSLSQILGLMMKKVDEFAKFTGKSVEEWTQLIKTKPAQALEVFLTKLKELDNVTAVQSLKDLGLDSVETSRAVLGLSKNIDLMKKNLSTAQKEWQTNTSLQKEYETASKSLNAQIEQTKNTIKLLIVKLSDELLPVLKSANDSFREWVQGLEPTKIQQFGQFIGDLISVFATVGGAIGDFVSHIVGIVAEYPKLSFALIGLYKSMGMLQDILPTVTGSLDEVGTAGGKLAQSMPLLSKAIGAVGNSIRLLLTAMGPGGAILAGAFAAVAGGVELYTQALQKDIEANNQATQTMQQSTAGLQKLGQLYSQASEEMKQYGGVSTQTQTQIKTAIEQQIATLEKQAQAMQQNGIETESQKLAYESLSGTIGTLKAKLDTLATTYPISIDADTAQAEQKIEQTKQSTQNQQVKLKVDADTTQITKKTNDTKAEISKTKATIHISAEDSKAQARLSKIRNEIANLQKKINLSVSVEDAQAINRIRELEGLIAWQKMKIEVDANDVEARNKLSSLEAEYSFLKSHLTVSTETQDAQMKLLQLKEELRTLESNRSIKVDADTTQADSKIQQTQAKTQNTQAKIKVSAEDAEAQAKIAKLIADAKALNMTVKINADLGEATQALGEFERMLGDLKMDIPVSLNDSDINTKISDIAGKVNATKTVLRLNLDTQPATQTLQSFVQKANATTATIHIKADTNRAIAAINQLRRPTSSTHTVYVKTVQTRAEGGYVQKLASGGVFTGSGRVPGYDPTDSDRVNARLTGGEYVIRREAVKEYGVGLLDAINRIKVPKFSSGGRVSTTAQKAQTTYRPVNIHIGGQSFEAQMEDVVVEALTKTLKRRGF